ncbi:hypothetical protein CLF_113633 [Clonorchis sinensis]|uniref:Neuroblastoma-amplified sequence n=1 Tax=Clonorchis sinensis TaxID=79923 RepID=H2KVW3_CLOSI|nr:hypothetical protein CLF_113633 [Clonorchis sinensis]
MIGQSPVTLSIYIQAINYGAHKKAENKPDRKRSRPPKLVNLVYADGIVLIFEDEGEAQALLNELTTTILSFGVYLAPVKFLTTDASEMLLVSDGVIDFLTRETTTYWTRFADNSNGSHLPCINDQLALWDVTTQAYQDPRDDVDVATCLLRCYALSSRVVRNKFKGRTQATSNRKSLLPYYAVGLYEFLCSSWQHVRITLESWASPSSTLVSYAHLRNRGSPWHLGYLSSTGSSWRALCLVTTEYVELIQLITDTEQLLSDSISPCLKDEETLLSELLDEFTENQPPDFEPPSRVNRSPLRQSTRWNLSHTDPWPRWRCVAFSPEQPTQGCSYRQVAVGYSCGSIEVIDLSALSNELNGTRQTSIVLSSPCSTQSLGTDFKSCFFPLTHIAFVDSCHLIACHFSGHVDLWHLDWEAKRYPARLMTRLYVEQLCPNKRTTFPLTAADYDSQSRILVLAGLGSNPAPVAQLNQSFELHSFHVSLSPPYLAHIQSSETDSCLPATGLLSYLHRGKTALTQWMSEAIRHVHRPYPSGTDVVAFLQMNSSGQNTVIAALHCFGTCSVWSLPRLDPLFLVLGCSPLDVSPSSNAFVDPSQPFRLTWWAVPSKKEDSDSLTVAVDNSDDLAQLVVLRERGELSILKFGDTQIDKLMLDERQVHELNLSCYASFAYVDQASSGKIILLDQKTPSDALWKTVIFGDITDANRRVLRAIRLSSTTPSGLYNHLIRKGCYQDAIQLALRHQQDVELVYQQQWLDLSRQVSDLCGLPTIIDSTLALIRHRPMWVLRQCLSFIPSTHATVFVSAGDFFASMRHLLKLGLERVSDLSTEHTEQMQEAVRTQLLRRLFHVECLADILLAEQANEGEPFSTDPTVNYHYPLDCLVEHLHTFRQHALLDIARFYADSEQFSAVRVMMNKFPLTVGSHRLALASSLCETIHPASYVTHLLVPPSFPVEAEPPYASRGTEFEMTAVERLYSVLTFPAAELTVDFRTQDSSTRYAQKLVTWLMRRARQIDTRAGLIVYDVSKGTRTNPTRANLSVRSSSKQIALARFGFSHFSKLSIEDRIDLLLQIKQPPQRVKTVIQKSHIVHPVLFSWGQLMVYIKQIGDGRHIRKWTTYSLVRLATYHTFDILAQLAGMIEAGTLCQLFQEILPPLPFEHSAKHALGYRDSCGLTDTELLTCILEAVLQYEPAIAMQVDRQPADNFKSYLKDVNHLISLLFRCLASANLPADKNESAQLACALQIFAQCASALTSLLSLSASIEKQVGHAVRLGVKSVGDFVRCAYETSRLQRFLAHWMSTILGLLQPEIVTKAPGPREEAEKEQLLKKVESFVGQLRDLLHKALSGCPAEQWIPTGMQFSLLTAGNIQLFELSERLQSEYLNEQVEGKSSLHVWSVCLLHALRNYVDTCVPQASLQSGVRTKKLESLPPNERMARHCLSLFLALDSRVPLDRSVKKAFEMEQCLLDVSAFLSSVIEHLPSTQHDTTPRHYSAMYGKGSSLESHLEECLPYPYLPIDSSTSDIFMATLVDGQRLKHGSTIDVRERSWWRLFLHHWLFTDGRSDPVLYPSRKILSLSTSAGDFRLSLAYAAVEATFVKLGGDPAVQDDILFQLAPSVRLMETQIPEYVFRPEPVSFADQSQLVTLAYAFGAWTQPDDSYRASDCFISGEKALKNLSKPVLDVAPKAFQPVVDFLAYKAIAQQLCDRVTAILPVFDSIRFNEDEVYKQQTIQSLCATHFSIGVRLCLYSNRPLIEACNARLIHLFLEQPRWSLEVEEEITRLASCMLQFHDTSKSDLLQFCEETLYPSIQDLPALRLLFSLIAAADTCSNQTCLLDEIPVDTHQSILTLFTSCPNCTRLAEQIGYARFIQLLKSPFSRETNGWRHHELSVYLTTEQMAGTIAKVLSLFSATIESGLSSGDLYAMYSLNALQSEPSFRQFQDKSSTLRPLLRNICLPMDVRSFERLRNWLHEFVFNKLSNQLTVEQRRWVLAETVDFLRSLNEFIKSLLSEALSLTSEDTDRRRSTLLHLSDQLQTVIELFLLLIGDTLDSPLPTERGENNQQRLDSQLWAYWFELCHRSGLFAESNFNLSAYLLLHQWVKYGLPPHGLALAALDAMKQSRNLPQSDSTRWSMVLESNVFNICLCQRDQVLVLDTLNTLCANASVASLIDLDVCVCFVCLHGQLWPDLVKPIKDKPHPVCSPLFRHILRAIELYLSQRNCDDSGRIFTAHCMTLLHRAGLWIEAGRLARILQGSSADHTAFQTLINFVRREQLP